MNTYKNNNGNCSEQIPKITVVRVEIVHFLLKKAEAF
jgi:hypothetical protein